MSISPTHNSFISHDTIDTWMQARVTDAYGDMGAGMDVTGHRADAEKALNAIKAALANAKANGGQPDWAMYDDIRNAAQAYADVPGVEEALGKMVPASSGDEQVSVNQGNDNKSDLPPPKLSDKQIEAWSGQIADTVEGLGKDDQLGMIHLNQLNSHINQTEQIASAITDSRNKTLDAIINRIG